MSLFDSSLIHIMNRMFKMCVYLWGDRAENASSSSDEISNKHGEARQAEEEETRRAGTDDGVHNILMTSTKTQKHINVKRHAAFPLLFVISHQNWLYTRITSYHQSEPKTKKFYSMFNIYMRFFVFVWAQGLISQGGGKQKYFVNGPPCERHGREKAFSFNR